MKYGKIENDILVIISFVPQDNFIEIPDEVFAGYICQSDGSFTAPEITSEEKLAQCKADLAEKRWNKTEQGVTIDGVAFQSDQSSKDEMCGYISNGVTEIHWKHSDGNIITYPIAYFTDVYHLVQQYRNDCFGVEKSKVDAMDTATDPTTVDIETGWPDTTFTTS